MNKSSLQSRTLVAATILGLFFCIFGPVIFLSQSLVYRDAGGYFHPLFRWSCSEWASGRIPLWNPHDNCGMPAAGDASYSVFYPGQLIFALPFDFTTCYQVYILAHLLLAAGAAYLLARRWRASTIAAGVCAVSYGFGGSVLFQHCNVIYLIGSAWLPMALWAADHMLRERSTRWALVFGIILAGMTLGGDPQAAYHAGLIATGYALLLWLHERPARREAAASPPGKEEKHHCLHFLVSHRVALLVTGALTGALLAAVQVVPSLEWSTWSKRAAREAPRSLYEASAFLVKTTSQQHEDASDPNHAVLDDDRSWQTIRAGLFGTPARSTHHDNIYRFSLSPWRLGELLWPNMRGHRFSHIELRNWSASLYLGLLPLLLAAGSWRIRNAPVHVRVISWLVVIGVAGSFGEYGLGWLLHGIRNASSAGEAEDFPLGYAVGGVYWFLVVGLPGYAAFRYPAKLFVLAALGISLLAARGWDRTFSGQAVGLRRALLCLGTISLAGLGLAMALGPWWDQVSPDFRYSVGPLDEIGTARDVATAFFHTLVLSLVFWLLLKRSKRGKRHYIQAIGLLLIGVDLAIANSWMTVSAANSVWQEQPLAARLMTTNDQQRMDTSRCRVYRSNQWWYRSTQAEAAPTAGRISERITKSTRWGRHTLFYKHNMSVDVSLVNSIFGNRRNDYSIFLDVASADSDTSSNQGSILESHRAVLDLLGARYFLLPEDSAHPDATFVAPIPQVDGAGGMLWYNPHHFPRAWVVHHLEVMPPLRTNNPSVVAQRTRHVLMSDGAPRDLRHTAVVEVNGALPQISHMDGGRSGILNEPCRITVDSPQHVEIEASLSEPGLVVLSDAYYPGWHAQVVTDRATAVDIPILRTNRIMRGVYLPAGHHRIIYRFRPRSVYIGAVVTAISTLCVLAALIWRIH